MISFSLPASIFSTSAIVEVGHFLHFAGMAVVFVLADLVVLLELLEKVQAVAADVAHRDARVFGVFMGEFRQFRAAVPR